MSYEEEDTCQRRYRYYIALQCAAAGAQSPCPNTIEKEPYRNTIIKEHYRNTMIACSTMRRSWGSKPMSEHYYKGTL
jgi:hypothetical protein